MLQQERRCSYKKALGEHIMWAKKWLWKYFILWETLQWRWQPYYSSKLALGERWQEKFNVIKEWLPKSCLVHEKEKDFSLFTLHKMCRYGLYSKLFAHQAKRSNNLLCRWIYYSVSRLQLLFTCQKYFHPVVYN